LKNLLNQKPQGESLMPNVIGLFDNSSQAQQAIERMINAGIDRDQISLVTRDSDHDKRRDATTEHTSGAGKGAGIGAALGGVGGLIAGIAGLAIPGIGPIIAAGPIAAAIGGALGGAGLGAAAGGLIGALTDMGIPEEEARDYEDQVRQGKILVTVRADNDDEADRASNIMQLQGALDVEGGRDDSVEATPEYQGARSRETDDITDQRTVTGRADTLSERDFASAESAPAGRQMPDYDERAVDRQNVRTDDTATIPVTEERMVVGKRAVEGGRVRVYGRVSEKPVEESVRLRDERVNVERRAVDRPVTDADRKDDVMVEITEMREEPVVGKQERVVEEIVVGKTAEERTETVRDKVRRKDVEVDRTGTAPQERTHDRR
jgi:stress response protein YsnF